MLADRLRHWPNIKPTLFQYVVFAGYLKNMTVCSRPYHVGLRVVHAEHHYSLSAGLSE